MAGKASTAKKSAASAKASEASSATPKRVRKPKVVADDSPVLGRKASPKKSSSKASTKGGSSSPKAESPKVAAKSPKSAAAPATPTTPKSPKTSVKAETPASSTKKRKRDDDDGDNGGDSRSAKKQKGLDVEQEMANLGYDAGTIERTFTRDGMKYELVRFDDGTTEEVPKPAREEAAWIKKAVKSLEAGVKPEPFSG